MEIGWKRIRLGSMRNYFFRLLKFYELKNEKFTPVIFVFVLGIIFCSQLISASYIDKIMPLLSTERIVDLSEAVAHAMKLNIIQLGISILLNLVLTVYLIAYIKDLKSEPYSLKNCLLLVLRKSVIIVLGFLILGIAMALGLILLVVPALILYLMFLFANCYIVDKGMGIIKAFKASMSLTKGVKLGLLRILLSFFLIFVILPSFFIAIKSPLILTFVSSFVSTVIGIMYNRLIASMYVNLEYGKQVPEKA